MKEFCINIRETLEKKVYVWAETAEDALAAAEDNWKNGDYILDAESFVGVEFEEAKES